MNQMKPNVNSIPPGMLVQILRQHHVEYRRRDGRLWALEVIFDRDGRDVSQWVDVTHWSMRRLLRWLGY